MSIELEDVVPTAAAAGRLPPTLTLAVCRGGTVWPIGSFSAPTGALVFTWPPVAAQPWTTAPSGLTSWPEASNENAPARL